MAIYPASRVRLLTGLGRTFTFVPRRRGMRGLGQGIDESPVITPDFGPAPVFAPLPQPPPPSVTPVDTTMIDAGTQLAPPPSFFTNPAPIIPAQNITPVQAPNISAGIPGAPAPGGGIPSISIAFPSGVVAAPPKPAAPTTSWFSQQMISGVPNLYLALGLLGVVVISAAKKGRR